MSIRQFNPVRFADRYRMVLESRDTAPIYLQWLFVGCQALDVLLCLNGQTVNKAMSWNASRCHLNLWIASSSLRPVQYRIRSLRFLVLLYRCRLFLHLAITESPNSINEPQRDAKKLHFAIETFSLPRCPHSTVIPSSMLVRIVNTHHPIAQRTRRCHHHLHHRHDSHRHLRRSNPIERSR